jgi:FMN phosphatase YigB (HAD superfamily)
LEEARDHVELETGTMDEHEFAVRTAALLGRPSLRSADIRAAWSSVLGHQNVQLLTAAKDFARRGRVLLASNTNPIHWPQCVQILSAPDAELSWVEDVILSFEVGALKPAESFFAEVSRSVELGTSGSVPRTLFVDDKEENVAAARNAGIGAVVHRSNSETIAAIHALR